MPADRPTSIYSMKRSLEDYDTKQCNDLELILRQDIVVEKYTDIEINLSDSECLVSLKVHKVVLAYSSKYFDKLFNFGGKKVEPSITIGVDNARIAHDVILSFYKQKINSTDYPDWKYILETFICRDFFCLENDVSKLYNLIVPADDFELLLRVICRFDYVHDPRLIETIKINIPIGYNLEKNTKEFVDKLTTNSYSIVSFDTNGMIKKWSVETGLLFEWSYPSENLLLSPDGLQLAVCKNNNDIQMYEFKTGRFMYAIYDNDILSESIRFDNWINCMAFSHDNLKFVSGYNYGPIILWELNTHDDYMHTVDFSHDNRKIISNSYDYLRVWDVDTGSLLMEFDNEQHDGVVSAIFSMDDLKIIAGYRDGKIDILDSTTGLLLSTLNGHTQLTSCIIISPDNRKIASGSADTTIRVWEMETGKLLCELSGHTCCIECVAFSHDNLKIASCDESSCIKIWDVAGQLLNTLTGHGHLFNHININKLVFMKPFSNGI